MSLIDDHLPIQNFETGLKVLEKRQKRLSLLAISSVVIFFTLVVASFFQQDFVYGFFGLSTEIQQLHVVPSLGQEFVQPPDYLLNLFSWFVWLFVKLLVSFVGAFFAISLLKRFAFFRVRFQSFVLKFVGWLIAFIVLWSGLTYVQYDLKNDKQQQLEMFTHYDENIHESLISEWLKQESIALPIQDYFLAQTALLHRPADKATAMIYTQSLMRAEQNDPHFFDYGFKPEQIWTLQQQIFGESKTPLAKSIEPQVKQAKIVSKLVKYILYILIVVSLLVSIVLYMLAWNMKKRIIRIEERIV